MNSNKIKVIRIKCNYYSEETFCFCCGKNIKNQEMWEVIYQKSKTAKIEPLHFCYKCAPTKDHIIKMLDCDEYIPLFSTNDLLHVFVAILKIKNISHFNSYHLMEYIRKCKAEERFNEILDDWTSISKDLDTNIESMIKEGLLIRIMPNINTEVFITKNYSLSEILKEKNYLDFIEEVLAFTNGFYEYEKAIFYNYNNFHSDSHYQTKKEK